MPNHTLRFISYGLGIARFKFWHRNVIYRSSKTSRPPLGPNQLTIHWKSEAFSPRTELLRHEDKHSPASSDEFKNEWNKAPTPPT